MTPQRDKSARVLFHVGDEVIERALGDRHSTSIISASGRACMTGTGGCYDRLTGAAIRVDGSIGYRAIVSAKYAGRGIKERTNGTQFQRG